MPDSSPSPSTQTPLSPAAFAILLALTGGEKHGYLILREVARVSGGHIRLLPGTLYNLLKRMLGDGWIEESGDRPDPELDDERRRYYRLTALGERIVSQEARRLEGLVQLARQYGVSPQAESRP